MEFILDMQNNQVDPFKGQITSKDYSDLEILRCRLQTHNLYPHIGTLVTCEKLDLQKYFYDSNHMIFRSKVGYVSGNKLNPLDRIYVYKTKDLFINGFNVKAYSINKTDISHIISETYQEYITMVYRKDRDPKGIYADKELFQSIKETFLHLK